MSADASPADASQSNAARRFRNPSLWQVTLILPKTGERVKKAFTLRKPPRDLNAHEDDQTPLLGRRASQASNKDRLRSIFQWTNGAASKGYAFLVSKTGQSILKCSLAYLLGSMATFVGPISALLGKNDGKHVVATVTVYFHPARSAGSMEEAVLLALVAFFYAAFVSFTSMAVSAFFGHHDLLALGHAIVLIVFCGGGLGFVGWLKQRLGNPLVNVACSLTSLAIITVLTKEGAVQAATFSYEKVFQVLKMVIMGIIATTAVSLIIKPVSARKELRGDIWKATDSLGIMLTTLTRSFLSGSEDEQKDPAYVAASNKYSCLSNTLAKDLRESKFEFYLLGTETEYRITARLISCMERLSQNINGLRSAAATQFALIAKSTGSGEMSPTTSNYNAENRQSKSAKIGQMLMSLDSIVEGPEDVSDWNEDVGNMNGRSDTSSAMQTATTASDIFSLFITHLGPSMKSLAYTLREILDELPFGPAPDYPVAINSHFRSSLVEAIDLFTTARKEALTLLYRNKILTESRSIEIEADYEEIAASCGYFSSSLQDFAEDMLVYLDILEELKTELDKTPRRRTWHWLYFWRKAEAGDRQSDSPMPQDHGLEQGLSQSDPTLPHASNANFEKSLKHHENTSYSYRLWRALSFFRREDIKYAIKVGAGAVLYAMWSFIPKTRPFYSHWRGEWGLLSYMLVCSMTIGASNTTAFQRFLGTCLGGCFAIVAWVISNENPFLLAFLGWLVSLGCFYIIIGQGKGPMGRFILLTYNLSALYAYSLSVKDEEDDDDEGGISPYIWSIVLHRVVAVMTGCIWGLIVTRLVWPISARQKLKDGIAIVWLRMGLIWKRDPLTVLEGDTRGSYMGTQESLELQRFLTRLETLQSAATHEFELRGPFPEAAWKKILQATGRMLGAFHAMNVLISKDLKASPGEAEILKYTRSERLQLSARISHLFSVLASSMKLEYPLTDALPNIEHTRDRLLSKIFEFRKNYVDRDIAKEEDYELLYAYALVTGQLAQEIETIGGELEGLYGTLNEDRLKLQ